MKCPVCGGIGITDLHTPNVGRCTKCNGSGEIEPTNEEYMRYCTTEQLAEAIYECVMTHPWHISKEVILEWLKQPYKPFS